MDVTVIIYSTPSCQFCSMAKSYFLQKKIPFVDYDVSNDKEKAEEMVKKSGQTGVPVIDINGKIIVGFDRERIERALTFKAVDASVLRQNIIFDFLEKYQ